MAAVEIIKPIPWWKEPTKDQWLAWSAAWLGWTLDAFDFTIFLLIMLPISQEFNVPLTAVTAVFICGRPPLGKGKRWDRCSAWSDAVICPALDAAGRQPPACMGVRGPGPVHPKRARGTVESPGCPSPVSPTVAPYSPSARPYAHAGAIGLCRRDRSFVDATFDQQSPSDAGHLVGQGDGDQHLRLASQHLRQP